MQFGTVPLDQADGAILAHSVALPGGGRLRKGLRLTPEALAQIRAAGHGVVTVARLEGGDVHEDAAAMYLATALVPDPAAAGLELRAVGTGRVNIHANGCGVADVNGARIHAVNGVDPMISVATVAPWHRMAAGDMVATVKIIAYGVGATALQAACDAGDSALQLHVPVIHSATLIQSVNEGDSGDKGHRVLQQRLAALSVTLAPPVLVAHEQTALCEAITAARDSPLILILTASATSDPGDVAPQALRDAGGVVVRFGMPVDPGNLLFIGHLGAVPVIGLPGCVKSPALNGADWVMERLICGVPVTSGDIAAMGVGGLLKEIPTRPHPREPRQP